jgi:adenosylcobinamide amidohydrolase
MSSDVINKDAINWVNQFYASHRFARDCLSTAMRSAREAMTESMHEALKELDAYDPTGAEGDFMLAALASEQKAEYSGGADSPHNVQQVMLRSIVADALKTRMRRRK